MKDNRNVFLVGSMGAGKSTIGRFLSDFLHLEFVDSDSEIEKRTGADIPWIFDVEGEEGFRKREANIINDLTQRQGIVLATGGGVVVTPSNRQHLSARGIVVYLATPVEIQYQRTLKDRRRPLLQTEDPLKTLEELMQNRDPLYREIADYVVDTTQSSAKGVAQEIVNLIERF